MPDETVDPEVMAHARSIFDSGRVLHDLVLRVQTTGLKGCAEKRSFTELTMSQLYLVKAALREERVTISQLAELLGVSPPSASAMVNRLVGKGILNRRRSEKDRRVVEVSVSPEAMADIRCIEHRILMIFVDIIEKIGPEMAGKWCEVLACVKNTLQSGGDPEKQRP